ncbi:MAG: MlaD family protein [Bacteroidales bacterium]|nr:MlaD family protein [Bacteroidales bacterium]
MENKRKSGIIGLSFVGALILFIWGYNFLKGKSLLEEYPYYYAVYQNVDELAPANKVLVNGMLVGQVEELFFNPNQDGSIIVKFTASRNIRIPADSKACITGSLLGSKSINIILGNSSTDAKLGDTLASSIDNGITEMISTELMPLKNKVETLVMSIDTLVGSLNSVLDATTRADVKKGVNDLSVSLNNLNKISNDLQQIMSSEKGNITDIVENVGNISENLSAVSDSLAQIKYNQLVASLQSTIDNLDVITTNLKNGEGSAGLLLNNDSLYINLTKTVDNLGVLIKKIEENPKKYIRVKVF